MYCNILMKLLPANALPPNTVQWNVQGTVEYTARWYSDELMTWCSALFGGSDSAHASPSASASQVRSRDDVLTCARHMHTATLAPVLLTSAVTGDGLDLVRLFYNLLPPRQRWAERARPSALPVVLACVLELQKKSSSPICPTHHVVAHV